MTKFYRRFGEICYLLSSAKDAAGSSEMLVDF